MPAFTTLAGVLGAMPNLTQWDRADLQRSWLRVSADGLTAWRTALNTYFVMPEAILRG